MEKYDTSKKNIERLVSDKPDNTLEVLFAILNADKVKSLYYKQVRPDKNSLPQG